jgi:dTDP-4-dehydrorhamnose 3,5-epimerase
MPFIKTELPGVFIFEPRVFEDSRGFFFEAYNEQTFRKEGITTLFIQDNQSFSRKGTIRGLHYQLEPWAQAKLVRVLQGNILDVIVDIRIGSPTYARTLSIELSGENKKQLFIPRGFAHGFSVLSESAEILYKCDQLYNKDSESGIRYNDSDLHIDWKVKAGSETVSDKDLQLPVFTLAKNNFEFKG